MALLTIVDYLGLMLVYFLASIATEIGKEIYHNHIKKIGRKKE